MVIENKVDLTKYSDLAHLFRRAGFGINNQKIKEYSKLDYEDVVEELLNPKYGNPEDQDLMDRYFPASVEARSPSHAIPQWSWRLAKSEKILEEKIALFWHGLLAVGGIKLDHGLEMLVEIDLFRKVGLGKFRNILQEISRSPGMMYWLDNQNSHKDAPNENYGRELLELFSMGINESGEGAYTEQDVKEAARAFTGWASRPTPFTFFLGPFPMEFKFDPDDHDDEEKTFLGETGNWNGDDIIDIIVRNRVTAEFICKRLYLFFVSNNENHKEIQKLADVFQATDGEIKSVLREIFLSDHFRSEEVRFKKTKSPTELVFGTTRLTDRVTIPDMDSAELAAQTTFMGQFLLNPPSVEGWHEGEEWIDSGALVERINFVSSELSHHDSPGIKRMIDEVVSSNTNSSPEKYLSSCLQAMGFIEISDRTKSILVDHIEKSNKKLSEESLAYEIFTLIGSTPDYQYC
ncbi:MAG: hypothetical protein CL780_01580 [Chloroflexi bacterium]|nr:hypothetical protein [Chloroflexota bacterium]